MGLFQKSVVKAYLHNLGNEVVQAAYDKYKMYFLDAEKQANIKKSKEEQYQEGFLRELFVDVLGYTINPNPNYNLITEQQNTTDQKKADAAIIVDTIIKGVIELKGTNTVDLHKIQDQAFRYYNNHPDAVYVITSNFERLRFYIQKTNEYEEFNLFTLTREEFNLLYLCISYDSISRGIPLKIKTESVVKEQDITKSLYKDYSVFKQELYQDLIKRNPGLDKLLLFKASQKLIDRFLFIFFCEDNNGLLPANSIAEIIKHWNKLRVMDEYRPLYDIFKKYFEYINTGRPATGDRAEIFAYNGGLFAEGSLLDSLLITDTILYKHSQQLSTYDFVSEVDVNILGHIFEHSLNEIEEIQSELEGTAIDKTKSKRKKDGVFYTPKYITEYIVENTVGKLCTDKKQELGIDEDEFVNAKTSKARTPLYEKLQQYKNYVLSLTICDPACGSGAFLNQAYIYLQQEHQYIATLEGKLFDTPITLTDFSAEILENNLYGVDINEESVEIARLSLWLRSAKKGRKLNNLSNNIKCGNSLIDDPEVAGDKAFNWEKEFPQVFEKGGFDVVIGNPPYLNMTRGNTNHEFLLYYISSYESVKNANSKNLFTLFNERSITLLNKKGILSFIIPEGFLKTRSYDDCVNTMQKHGNITKAVYFEEWVFEEATTGSVIFEYSRIKNYNELNFNEYKFTKNRTLVKINNEINHILEKYNNLNFKNLQEYCEIFKGMVVQNRKDFIHTDKNTYNDKFYLGNCIDRYLIKENYYCNYNDLTIIGGTKKRDKYKVSPRILIRRTGNYLCCVLLEEEGLTESTLYSCYPKNNNLDIHFLLGLLNSKFLTYIVRQNMITNEQAFPQILMTDIQLIKLPSCTLKEQNHIKTLVVKVIENYKNLNNLRIKFLKRYLES